MMRMAWVIVVILMFLAACVGFLVGVAYGQEWRNHE